MHPLATSSGEIDTLLEWLKGEICRTEFGEVGLKFKIHEGAVVGIERTTSLKGRFELRMFNENGGD